MTTKKTGSPRQPEDMDLQQGREDAPGDAVVITRTGVYPVALRRAMAKPETREVVEGIQDCAAMIEEARMMLEQIVPIARARGISWDSIGWLVGLSGTQAQARWGTAKQRAR